MRREELYSNGTPTPSPLPAGYTRLNYIECTGENYIDTGVKPSPDFKWHYVFQWVSFNSGDSNMNGVENWNNTNNDVIVRVSQRPATTHGTVVVYGDMNNFEQYKALDYPNLSITTFYLENGHQYINGVEVCQGVITKTGSQNICFFCSNVNGNQKINRCKTARVYYSWMKNGDTLIREFIPALRVSDSKPGLYDAVDGLFYTSSGSGEFNYA